MNGTRGAVKMKGMGGGREDKLRGGRKGREGGERGHRQ